MKIDLTLVATQIDESCEAKDAAELKRLIETCETALVDANGSDRVDLNYFIANAYSVLWQIRSETEGPWEWKAHEVIQEIFALRRAIAEPEFERSEPVRQCQIRTNLANNLSTLGRSVEAIEEYSKVLGIDANFALALGNRAYAITTYSWYLYDHGHQSIMLNCAMNDYRCSLQPTAFWDSGFDAKAADQFSGKMIEIKTYLDGVGFDDGFDLSSFSMGETPNEIEYRRWCLSNHLFLNPLNDVMEEPIVATDVLHLPSHSYTIEEEARLPALYNILKQEFVSARFHLFMSREMDEDHFADRDVLLFDSLDYGQFDFRTEQLKLAFRSAYSIFDKIALFLNDYFAVGLAAKQVSFRQIWESQVKGGKIELRDAFVGSENLPLRGMYFLAKDFFDDDFIESASPDAKGLAELRNFVEHRFLTLTEIGEAQLDDTQHRHVPREEFYRKTLRLLKMARSSLIYLSMAMQREEKIRNANNNGDDEKLTMSIRAIPRVRSLGI